MYENNVGKVISIKNYKSLIPFKVYKIVRLPVKTHCSLIKTPEQISFGFCPTFLSTNATIHD